MKIIIFVSLALITILSSCVLTTQWSENLALKTNKTEATNKEIIDGKLDTIAIVPPSNDRVFGIKFDQPQKVRRVIIHNQNLFRFDLEYWDAKKEEWRQAHTVRQRRDLDGARVQPKFVIDRLNFTTDKLRINVMRTVDDRVISKPSAEPNDRVVNKIRKNFGSGLVTIFRVVVPSHASIREIEVYALASN